MNIKSAHAKVVLPAGLLLGILHATVTRATSVETVTNLAATNTPRWLSTNATQMLVWKGFEFHPSLRAGIIYDDNIQYSPGHTKSDVINQVSPGIQIVGGDRASLKSLVLDNPFADISRLSASSLILTPQEQWPGKIFTLNYNPQWQLFDRYTDNDSFDQFLKANLVVPLSKVVVGFQQDYQYAKAPLLEATNRIRAEYIHTAADIGYRFDDQTSVNTLVEVKKNSYPGQSAFAGFTEYKGQASLNRQVVEHFTASVFMSGAKDVVDNGPGQDYIQAGGRLRYQLSKKFEGDLQIGGEYREFDSSLSDMWTPFFNLELDYRWNELTDIKLGAGRNQYASLNRGYYYESTGGYLNIHRSITKRFAVQGNLAYFHTDNKSSTQINTGNFASDYYSAQIAADINLFHHLNAQAYYLLRGGGLFVNYNTLVDNQIGMQFKWGF